MTLRWIDVGGEHFALFEWPIHTSPIAPTADPLDPAPIPTCPTDGHATSNRPEPSIRAAPRAADDGAGPRRAPPDLSVLSPAERAVLAYVTRGDSNAQIAIARKTSTRTVANQVAKLLRKLGASSRFDLIRWFGRE